MVSSPSRLVPSSSTLSTVILATPSPTDDADFIVEAFLWSDSSSSSSNDDADPHTSLFCREDGEVGDDNDEVDDENDLTTASSSDPVVTVVSHRLGVSIHLVPSSPPRLLRPARPIDENDDDENENERAAPTAPSPVRGGGSVGVATYTCPPHEAGTVVRQLLRRFVHAAHNTRGQQLRSRLRVHPSPSMDNVRDNTNEGGGDDDSILLELALPSGSSIVLVPSNLTTTRRGRNRLNRFLMGNFDGGTRRHRTAASATAAPREFNVPDAGEGDEGPCLVEGAQVALSGRVPSSSPSLVPDPRILFPTLNVHLLDRSASNNINEPRMNPFPVNSPVGQEFETELFRGRLLLVMRPQRPELDPHWNARMFAARKRRILVQIQGQFRREPRGTVYAGAEVSDPMKLGLLARGLSGVLLRIVEGFNPSVHYSFGTEPSGSKANGNPSNNSNDGDEERAHIVVPAYSFFERFVATPPGQVPPDLGEEWDEPKESRERRKNPKEAAQFRFNDHDTYSFSFYSMYMDLPTWQLVNLPIVKGDVSLKTFWRDSLLRICMYERHVGGTEAAPIPKQHLVKYNSYAFLLQIQYSERMEEDQQDEQIETLFRMSGSKYVESNGDRANITATAVTRKGTDESLNRSESQLFPVDDETTIDPDVTTERDEDNDHNEDDMSRYLDAVQEQEWESEQDADSTQVDLRVQPPALALRPPSSASRPSPSELLSRIDDQCPLFLDAIKNRSGYARMYMVHVDSQCSFRTLRECEDFASDASRSGPVQKIVSAASSPRLSSAERLRRVVGCVLANPSTCLPSREDKKLLNQFVKVRTSVEGGQFLGRPEPSLNDRERASLRWSGFAARAVSDRHWMEEFVSVTHRSVSFSHPDKRKANSRIMIRSIEKVTKLPSEACPRNVADLYSFLEIETLGRSIYLMFANTQQRGAFKNEITKLRAEAGDDDANSSLASNPLALDIENPADEFMHKSSLWNLKNRRLLNGGKFFFSSQKDCSALELVETALRRASAVANDPYDEYEQRHSFLVSAAELKRAHVQHLPEDYRLVFFLNLYHLMILHAFIVLGPPDSSLQWISYFNNASYEIADDVFSLAELEHCIVRNQMSPPSQFLSRFVLPKSRYSVALSVKDFRINFALNCGSLSNPSRVCCYRVAALEEQLDAATRLYLEGAGMTLRTAGNGLSSSVSPTELVLYLPRVCQWFLPDFGDGVEPMLRVLEPYFKDPIRRALERFKMRGGRYDMGSITVRYYAYNFECRPFTVVEDA